MIFIKKNGQIVRADGKDLREVVVIVSESSQTIGEISAPVLTSEDVALAYNSMVAGKVVAIATENSEILNVNEANSVEDVITLFVYFKDSHIIKYVLENDQVEITAKEIGEGTDVVESVNGQTGIVVLDADDIIYQNAETIKTALDNLNTSLSGKENTSNKISSLDDATDNVKYLGAKVVADELQNVRNVAEGKTKSLIISYNDTDSIADIKQDISESTPNTRKAFIHERYGEKKEERVREITQDILNGDYDYYSNVNASFNSQELTLSITTSGVKFILIVELGLYGVNKNYHLYRLVDDASLFSSIYRYFNLSDNIIVKELDVPDRYFIGAFAFFPQFNALETSKVDLTNYYNKGEVDGLLDDKADVGDSYTKQETDDLLDDKANSSDVYSKTDADDLFATKTELGGKQNKSTARTITTPTFNGGLNSNEFTEFTQPMTALTIASLDVATGDETPAFAFHFKLATGGTISFTPTIKWDCGNPQFEAGVDYIVVITKVGSSYFGALGEHY